MAAEALIELTGFSVLETWLKILNNPTQLKCATAVSSARQ